jgi:ABC-type amino acid transport substrate-binding protein
MTRIILIATMLAVIASLFNGCSTNTDSSLQTVLDSGQLVVGLDENFPPMGFRDDKGNLIGFDIDLAREVCKRLGISLKLQPIEWNRKEDELYSGRIDCIWNGMSVSADRRESMLLSQPYLENELVFAVRSYSSIQNINDLRGHKVGVQSGSTTYEVIKDSEIYEDIEVVSQRDNLTLLEQLKNGEIDAALIDSCVIYYIARNSEDFVLLSGALAKEEIAIGFRKEDVELRNKIQDTLSQMREDRTLDRISEKWFGSDITIVR